MKTFKDFCAEVYTSDEAWKQSKVPKSVVANQMKINKEKETNKIGSQSFSDRGGHAALKAGGGQAALRSGSSVSDVLHAGKRALQKKEGPYISPETQARTNLMNAQAEKLRREETRESELTSKPVVTPVRKETMVTKSREEPE